MKTISLGFGVEKPSHNTVRLQVDIGLHATKPANKHLRNGAAAIITVILFALSIYALEATDVRDTQPTAVVLP